MAVNGLTYILGGRAEGVQTTEDLSTKKGLSPSSPAAATRSSGFVRVCEGMAAGSPLIGKGSASSPIERLFAGEVFQDVVSEKRRLALAVLFSAFEMVKESHDSEGSKPQGEGIG